MQPLDKGQNQFLFHIQLIPNYISFLSFSNHVFATHSSFSSQNSSNLLSCKIFFRFHYPMHTSKFFNTFPYMLIKIPRGKTDFNTTFPSAVYSLFHHKNELFPCLAFRFMVHTHARTYYSPCTRIIGTTSFPKVATIGGHLQS